jgi:hypothetical protein
MMLRRRILTQRRMPRLIGLVFAGRRKSGLRSNYWLLRAPNHADRRALLF